MLSLLSFIFLSVLWISNGWLKNLLKCLKTTKRSWDKINNGYRPCYTSTAAVLPQISCDELIYNYEW